jgi:hypothetical protein
LTAPSYVPQRGGHGLVLKNHTRPITTLAPSLPCFPHSASSYLARIHKSRPIAKVMSDVRFALISGGKVRVAQRAAFGDHFMKSLPKREDHMLRPFAVLALVVVTSSGSPAAFAYIRLLADGIQFRGQLVDNDLRHADRSNPSEPGLHLEAL